MRRHEEKDAELDRRIVALRKKNQALLRRYQVSVLYRLRELLCCCPWLPSKGCCLHSGLSWRAIDHVPRLWVDSLSQKLLKGLGTGDVAPLPPGVPLVFLCVGLSASVCL